jgi:hypothetical protein
MALGTPVLLDSFVSDTDDTGGAGYLSASGLTLTSGDLVLVFVYNSKVSATAAIPACTNTSGITWTATKTTTFDSGLNRLSVYRALIAVTATGQQFTFGAGTTTNTGLAAWIVVIPGALFTDSAIAAGSSAAPAATSPTAGATAVSCSASSGTSTVTVPASWTSLGATEHGSNPTNDTRAAYIADASVTATWSLSGSRPWACAVVTVEAAPGTATLTGTATSNITEADIVTGGKTILLTLTNDTWVTAGATFDGERQAIINGCDSAQAEATGWDAEVKAKMAVTDVVRTSNTLVTITLPAEAAYNITAQETITVTIPGSAVAQGAAIVASPTFTVVTAGGGVVATSATLRRSRRRR